MPPLIPASGTNRRRLLFAGAALLVFLIAYFSPVNKPQSDPRYSLLVAQAILETGSISLEAYVPLLPEELGVGNYRINHLGGEAHYAYPIGPSLVALPAVAAARLVGLDMMLQQDEALLQNLLSALTAALTVVAAAAMAGTRLPAGRAVALALLATLGSSLISTGGSAYWTMNMAALAMLGALWLALRDGRPLDGLLLGGLLFLAFASRPTAALFIAPLLLYLLLTNRPVFWPAAAGALLPLLLLMGTYWRAFRLPLHPYYLPGTLGGIQNFDTSTMTPLPQALYGLLFSPSRGLVTFTPVLLLLGAALLVYWRHLWRRPLFWVALTWAGGVVLTVSRFTMWWGGYSFGPRLLTEIVPALLLLGVLLLEVMERHPPGPVAGRAWPAALMLLGLASIAIHTGSGLFNAQADAWNASPLPPRIEKQTVYLYDWRYPQFLATADMLCARNRDYLQRAAGTRPGIRAYQPGYTLDAAGFAPNSWPTQPAPFWGDEPDPSAAEAAVPAGFTTRMLLPAIGVGGAVDALFPGFSATPGAFRAARCPEAGILFGPLHPAADAAAYRLSIRARGSGAPVGVSLNGAPLQQVVFATDDNTVDILVDAGRLRRVGLNEISFQPLGAGDETMPWLQLAAARLTSVTPPPGAP